MVVSVRMRKPDLLRSCGNSANRTRSEDHWFVSERLARVHGLVRGCSKTPFTVSELTVDVVKRYRDELVNQGLKRHENRKLVFLASDMPNGQPSVALSLRSCIIRLSGSLSVAQAPRQPRGLSELELKRFLREVEMRIGEGSSDCLRSSNLNAVSEIVKLHLGGRGDRT